MTFKELQLSAPVLRAVREAGYETPSPIQSGAIPPILAGRDLMGCAQTGTGKTAAFALPMLEGLSQSQPKAKGGIRALILTPTRELALQIGESFSTYGKYLSLHNLVIFGGVGQAPQVEALKKGTDILIACPGRLNDLLGQGLISLSDIEIFVLDEADRMLDMGFVHDVKKVIARLPAKRQNLMFSATMPKEIEQLAAGILHEPAFVRVDPVSSTVERIDQSLYFVEKGNKKHLLLWLLKQTKPPIQNALVFSRTKHGADKIVRELTKANIPAAAIHGNKSQTARVTALEDFKKGKIRVLVATDIAARGIDINELSHVFNYDLPEVPETYVHRIGRTARAGAEGTAVSFCAPEEAEYLAGIEALNRKKIPVVNGHPWDGIPEAPKLPPLPRGRKPKVIEGKQEETAAVPQKNEKERTEMASNEKTRRPRRPRQEDEEEMMIAPKRPMADKGRVHKNKKPQEGERKAERANFDPHFLTIPEVQPRVNKAVRTAISPKTEQPVLRDVQAAKATQNAAPLPKERAIKNSNLSRPAGAIRPNRNATAAPKPQESRPQRPAQSQSKPEARPQSGTPAKPVTNQRNTPARPTVTPTQPMQTEPVRTSVARQVDNVPPVRSARPVREARSARGTRTENPGLLLISRRPPAQKFSNFEEYINAHGGATAPIEEQEGEV